MRDLRELKLVKTSAGYKPLANGVTEIAPLSALAQSAQRISFPIFAPPETCLS